MKWEFVRNAVCARSLFTITSVRIFLKAVFAIRGSVFTTRVLLQLCKTCVKAHAEYAHLEVLNNGLKQLQSNAPSEKPTSRSQKQSK